jgi:WD40 repeat protein
MECAGNTNVFVGLADGKIMLHSLKNMNSPLVLDQTAIRHQGTVWKIVSPAPGVIATGGEDGFLVVWRILNPFLAM